MTNGRFMTISGHFFATYIEIFNKTEVQTVILRCLTFLILNWFKSYDTIRKCCHFRFFHDFVKKIPLICVCSPLFLRFFAFAFYAITFEPIDPVIRPLFSLSDLLYNFQLKGSFVLESVVMWFGTFLGDLKNRSYFLKATNDNTAVLWLVSIESQMFHHTVCNVQR